MVFAHIAGVPVEELLPSAVAGGGLVLGHVWHRLGAYRARRAGRLRSE